MTKKPLIILSIATLLLFSGASSAQDYPNTAKNDYVPNQVIIKFKDNSTGEDFITNSRISPQSRQSILQLKSRITQTGLELEPLHKNRPNLALIKGEDSDVLIERYRNDPDVDYVKRDYLKQLFAINIKRKIPNDPHYNLQWSIANTGQFVSGSFDPQQIGKDIEFNDAWVLSRKPDPEDTIYIAIIDSGFDKNHPDLINQIWTNPDEIPGNNLDDDSNGYIDDIHGYDFALNSPNISGGSTVDQHGTHVAGICVAQANNALGLIGVQPYAKFIGLKTSLNGETLSTFATMQAMEYVIGLKNRGMNIVAVNASYGDGVFDNDEFNIIQRLMDAGILLITAAGNEGINLDAPENQSNAYPNNYSLPNIISVAATDSNSELANFSNYGSTNVDIAAPGAQIYSTLPGPSATPTLKILVNTLPDIEPEFIEFSGTIPSNGLSASVIDCQIGDSGDFPASVNNQIALIERGTLTFAQKVQNAMNAGAVAAIIFNNVAEGAGSRQWTLVEPNNPGWIPALSITQAEGQSIKDGLPLNIEIQYITEPTIPNYGYLSGTSMATPIVSGAVAFTALNFPNDNLTQRKARLLDTVNVVNSLSNSVFKSGIISLKNIVDSDSDNLPNWWELEHFGTLGIDGTVDSDNDTYTNREEFLAGTKPNDLSSKPNFLESPVISGLSLRDSNTLEFEFMGYPGYQYTVETLDSLSEGNWLSPASPVIGGGHIMSVSVDSIGTQPKKFFRLNIAE